jgi:ABC-type transport system substrate-binding protein
VPASWWFGDTTGLARRDFEMGAFAWVGQTEPAGRTLYACNQIPLPSNNWEGQNYMGWCNQTASDAVVQATNTLLREDRVAAYDILQREFAKDVVSIPVFNRAEAEAWSANLEGILPDATEYATTNLHEWTLADGGDTIVIGMTQEPDSMLALVSSMAAQRLVDRPAKGVIYTQYSYDFQPGLQGTLSTIESGLATNDTVEVAAGDMVYNTSGDTVELAAGVSVFDADGNVVEYTGDGTVPMKQLVVTYQLQDYTWSDGVAGSVADMELGFNFDCDPESGATTFITCNAIKDKAFAADALEVVVTWVPGYQDPTYMLYPFNLYPSHQVLADGRNLVDVPAAEWATLPEIAETPLSFGAYFITEWIKGQSLTLAANPNWWGGEVKTPNVIYVFVADTNQAVAQLLNGDVDYLDDSTLGAGAEVQTVIDAANSTGAVEYEISASSTWEHIDLNLFTK